MTTSRSFQCPNCGSPVSTSGTEKEVKCAYCGSTVIVPEELRDHTPEAVTINYGGTAQETQQIANSLETPGKVAAGVTVGVTAFSVILPVALTCIILAVVGFILYSVFSSVKSSTDALAFPTNVLVVETQASMPTLAPPTPFDTPEPFTNILLQDDFSDPSSGWDTSQDSDYTLEYVDGRYHVLINKADGGQITWPGDDHSDASIEVDVQQTAGPDDGSIGVTCRITDSGGLYSFEFSQDGSYGIYKYTDWNSSELDGGTLEPGLIKQNRVNHLVGICAGSTLTMLLNGEPLLQVQDSEYTTGGTGLVVRTGESGEPGIDVLFSNFLVKGP